MILDIYCKQARKNILKSFPNANVTVDGAIGSETIESINSIPDNAVNEFMVALKTERIDYLKDTPNWETAKNGLNHQYQLFQVLF